MNKFKSFLMIFIIVFTVTIIILGILWKHKQQSQKPKVAIQKQVIYKTKYIKAKSIDPKKFAKWIYRHSYRCSKKQVDYYTKLLLKTKHPLLFAAMISRESSFNVAAVSKSGAIGLMQVLPSRKHITQLIDAGIITEKRDLFSPETNIEAGAYIFADILSINGNDINKTLLMYCGGNKQYVSDVLRNLGQLTIVVGFDG